MKKLWGGRFKKELHETAKQFSYSLEVDHELLGADIKVSMAHALMLGEIGLISKQDAKKIVGGLWKVLAEFKRKPLTPEMCAQVEDVHTLIQDSLAKKIGPLAKKLHTGRSRNDLVATSSRIYTKEKALDVIEKIVKLQQALIALSEKNEKILIPGYTHLQRAQAILLPHHLIAYVEMLARDKSRLEDLRIRLNECPLGSGALAGSSLPLDRVFVARLLGFKRPTSNSVDAVSDRDYILETLSAISILMTHLSRLSEDLILWATSEFGFVTLSDEFSTGSSLMPQKKNPDMLELVKGKAAAATGNLVTALLMMKGLPLSYNRDMQEDKKPLFDSIRIVEGSLEVLAGVLSTLKVNQDAPARAVKDSFLYATDVLEYLVKHKVAFRDAHDIVGKLVQYAIDSNNSLSGLSFKTYQKFSPKFKKDVFDLFDAKTSVSNKKTYGSPNPTLVRSEMNRWKKNLRSEISRIKKAQHHHA